MNPLEQAPSPEESHKAPLPAVVAPSTNSDAKELEPTLSLRVAGPCQTPEGLYLGLSKRQRDALNVNVGDTVAVFDGERSLGIYTVGTGSRDLLSFPEQFTINGVAPESQLTLKKAPSQLETPVTYLLSHGVESDTKHTQRLEIISRCFPEADANEYITIPTALLNTLTGGRGRVPAITKGQVRIGDTTHTMVLVPSGTGIGLTTAAATKLRIPQRLTNAQVRVENGVLIFN